MHTPHHVSNMSSYSILVEFPYLKEKVALLVYLKNFIYLYKARIIQKKKKKRRKNQVRDKPNHVYTYVPEQYCPLVDICHPHHSLLHIRYVNITARLHRFKFNSHRKFDLGGLFIL